MTRVGSSCGCTGGNLSYPSFDCPDRKSTRLPKPVGSTTEFVLQGALHIPSRAKEIPYAIFNCFIHQVLPLSNPSEDSTIPFLPQPIHSCCQGAIENGTAETITLGIGVKPIKHFPQKLMDDPISLCTGTACERTALEAWFKRGEVTDPETGEIQVM
ncbi:hypothetical protein Vadar_027335 [Vaccinium darrowii]|uniref:Uncharacterized protein n=1 Tax=Vaccinium darrowii TaxID=229202 RepID=A0ACB7ZF79_9ERIC|nr:hypothetical protein Vadar_027335 [Vaccinium darrowii]